MAKNEDGNTEAQAVQKLTAEQLKERLFNNPKTKIERVPLNLFGVDFEWMPPTVVQSMAMSDKTGGDNSIVNALISFSYLPGTNEKLFTVDDYDRLCELPSGGDFTAVAQKLVKFLGASEELDEKVKN